MIIPGDDDADAEGAENEEDNESKIDRFEGGFEEYPGALCFGAYDG